MLVLIVPCQETGYRRLGGAAGRPPAWATFRWFTLLLGGVEPVVPDPLDELTAAPDVISGGGEDFSAFAVSRWPGLVRLAFGLTGDRWAAEDIAQATLARAYVAWRRVSRADDPDAYLRRILVNTSNRRFRRHRVAERPGDPPQTAVEGPAGLVAELQAVEPPVAPVDSIIRRGRGIRLRRAGAVTSCLGLAGIIAAATMLTPPPATQQPVLPVTVPASGTAGPGGVFASGTADGHTWRLAVQNIADPGYRCIPSITINGTDAGPVYPDSGNGAAVALDAAAPGIGFAFVQAPAGIERLIVDGRESIPVIAATVCGLRYRVAGFAYRLKHPPQITAVSARPGWPRLRATTGGASPDWPVVSQLPLISGNQRLADLARRALAGLAGRALEPAPVALPPGLVARSHVVVAFPQAGGAVDELADDVGLPGVPVGLGDHVDQDLVQRHLAPALRPPRHMTDRVQRERADGGVGVRPGLPVQAGDLLARLVDCGPHVRVGFGVIRQPRQRLAERAPEAIAEIAEFHAGHMLDQSQQVGAGGHHRAADVVLREPVELPQQGLAGILQIAV